MTSYMYGSILLGGTTGCVSFVLNYGHLLSSLLSLEFLLLMVYWWLSSSMVYVGKDFIFMLFYLVMWCSSGSLGLCLLISSVRTHGDDYIKSYTSLGC
uniref:NADH-ubiquinone oxidoreductase chain 4L n=1 Tax=Pallaseopsis kessleri TaxID=686709 RepID=A0A1L5BW57_9CRUS|nr:NADH dehydrogenase subunit 4L [Pallaseopsis kessleri]APL97204.1 NADH dehydrogenase subunit 4L [Pallaseopsis kessleri]